MSARLAASVVLAVGVHALVVLVLVGAALLPRPSVPDLPPVLHAKLVALQPAYERKPPPQPAPPQPAPEPRAEPEPRPEPAPRREPAPAPEASEPPLVSTAPEPVESLGATDPEPPAAEPPGAGARDREAPELPDLRAEFEALLAEESERAAEARAAAAREAAVQETMARIQAVIASNWSRPPSARNDMEATLLLDLVPTGEVVSVTVVRGSGHEPFDTSAVRAVRRAGRLPVPDDPALFEEYFRRFELRFRPEDLRY